MKIITADSRYFLLSLLIAGILFSGCSRKSETELFSSAREKEKVKNYKEAVADYEKVVDEYPEGEYAPRALMQIAKFYHMQNFKDISKEESYRQALNLYDQIYKNYPDAPEAQKALFLTGFLRANEFNQPDSARAAYELFLKKYPNSEMANSAKLELENIGVAPDEILQRKLKESK